MLFEDSIKKLHDQAREAQPIADTANRNTVGKSGIGTAQHADSRPKRYQNPSNNYIEALPETPWLWTLLFGAIYLLYRGLVIPALLYLIIVFGFSAFLPFNSWLVFLPPLVAGILFAVITEDLIEKQYQRKGWKLVDEQSEQSNKTVDLSVSTTAALPQVSKDAAASIISLSDNLMSLAKLKNEGILTEEEFMQVKAKLLREFA